MLSQFLINVIVTASVYVLIGTGFALIYNVSKFFNFAHGAVFMLCPYFFLGFGSMFGMPTFLSIPLSLIISVLVGLLMDVAVFSPIRHRTGSPLVLLLSSLGLYVIMQNMVSLIFGDDVKTIRTWAVEEGIALLGANITLIQIVIITTSICLSIAFMIFLKKTNIGKSIRAVSSDANLSDVCGINSDRVIRSAFGIGSGIAAVAGILVALDVDMTPTMGLNALMMGIVAVVIGGFRSVPGIILGALLVGLAQHFGAWKISSQWQDAIAFIMLLAFLLVRPEGVMGKKLKKTTV